MKYLSLFALIACAALADSSTDAYRRENDEAMQRMMASMHVPSTGDVDRDFVAMMTPHHQGAIDMAQLELRYGRNEQLRRLAQEIIVTQRQEIEAMAFALNPTTTPFGDSSK